MCVGDVDTVKVACDKQLAIIIAKGIDRFPDNTDGMFGFIDIWWIVRILLRHIPVTQ